MTLLANLIFFTGLMQVFENLNADRHTSAEGSELKPLEYFEAMLLILNLSTIGIEIDAYLTGTKVLLSLYFIVLVILLFQQLSEMYDLLKIVRSGVIHVNIFRKAHRLSCKHCE